MLQGALEGQGAALWRVSHPAFHTDPLLNPSLPSALASPAPESLSVQGAGPHSLSIIYTGSRAGFRRGFIRGPNELTETCLCFFSQLCFLTLASLSQFWLCQASPSDLRVTAPSCPVSSVWERMVLSPHS